MAWDGEYSVAVYHVSLKRLQARSSREPVAAATEASAASPPGAMAPTSVAEAVITRDGQPSEAANCTAPAAAKPRRQGSKSGRSARAEKLETPAADTALNGSAPSVPAEKKPAPDHDGSLPVEELLRLPREEAQAILAEVGESTGKVWLALIYRIASLEGQVRELAAELRSRPAKEPSSPTPAETVRRAEPQGAAGLGSPAPDHGVTPLGTRRHRANAAIEDESKTEMLEKVFRKNWSLRKQDSQ